MEYAQEIKEVEHQIAIAEEAHPKVCDDYFHASEAATLKDHEVLYKLINTPPTTYHGINILMEEVYEAFSAIADGDMRNAYTEFAQVATVAIRIMQKIREEEMK